MGRRQRIQAERALSEKGLRPLPNRCPFFPLLLGLRLPLEGTLSVIRQAARQVGASVAVTIKPRPTGQDRYRVTLPIGDRPVARMVAGSRSRTKRTAGGH